MKSFFKSVFATVVGIVIASIFLLMVLPLIFVIITRTVQTRGAHPIVANSILHLELDGHLVDKRRPFYFGDQSIFSQDASIGLFEVNEAIDLAKKDPRIKGLYLEIRSFSAGWAGLTALRRSIEDFGKSGKWVFAYADRLDEMSLYLASAAQQVFLHPHGDIELNGLVISSPFFKGFFEKLELEPMIFRAGKFKAAIEPLVLEQMSDENRAQTKTLVDDIWDTFRSTVATALKIDEKKLDDVAAQLLATSAEHAKALGLVHDTIFEDQLEDRMREATVGKDAELELVGPMHLLADSQSSLTHKRKKIALIFADGEIHSGTGYRDAIGSESLRQDILEAKSDEDVAAIVLRVNSPGGDALASDVIWRELMITDDEVPVVVSMGDVAASGGYYIASAGRFVFAEPTTITGSIGVFGVMFRTDKFFKNKAGVKFDQVTTHPYADIGSSTRAMAPMETQVIQREVDRVYKRFLDVVQESRGYEKRADLEAIAEGRVWSGVRAKELGLVDELGGLEQAMKKAGELAGLGTDYDVEIFPEQIDPLLEMIERLSGATVEGMVQKLGLQKWREMAEQVPHLPRRGVYSRMLQEVQIH